MSRQGLCAILPNLSAYIRELGFSSVVVGLLYTVMPIVSTIARPFLGMIADKFRCQKRIFFIAGMLIILSTLAILVIPKLDSRVVSSKVNILANGAAVLEIDAAGPIHQCSLGLYEDFQNTILCKENDTSSDFEADINILPTESIFYDGILTLPVKDILTNNKSIDLTTNQYSYFSCQLTKTENLNKIIPRPTIPDDQILDKYWTWLFFAAMLTFWISNSVVLTIADAICFTLLEDEHEKYGEQRMFGALGWGIFSAVSGYVTDVLTGGSLVKNYYFIFFLAISLFIVNLIVCYRIEYVQPLSSKQLLKDVAEVFLDIKVIVFFIWCICMGANSAVIWQFLYWLIEDLLLVNTKCDLKYYVKTLEGLVQTFETILGEIPFFFISGKIFASIGHNNAMSLIILGIAIRFTLYTVISNPWWFLPVELFNGIDVGLSFACMASYASFIAPPGTQATMQGLVGAVYDGIGLSMGSLVGGIFYKNYGGINTFKYFSYFALTVTVCHMFVQCFIVCFQKRK
ncbi:major facilitator superfamily domain-containing protein 6-like isoform X2 [Diabrotica virgifera virgifera]|uniref:Major facilitator superfamily domain-containing protein 6-like isoform X2 n=1 Tax=Diabrotica virgifera virgifera TaxID=50390 RepID=A0A6P7FK54_DIAVI|nr:major facilitator superfamily domain-containing protein 6-like isoform X2 [Diabrotica virgifera virgifera]